MSLTKLARMVTGHQRWLDRLFLAGLAGVFLANAVVALVRPEDFRTLLSRSELGYRLPLSASPWVAHLIAVNDLFLGAAILGTVRFTRIRAFVLAWSGVWLFAVSVIKLTAL